MESLGGGDQWRSSDVGKVVIFDFVNVGAEAGSGENVISGENLDLITTL